MSTLKTKTTNKINAIVEIQNQFVFVFTTNEATEEATNEAIEEATNEAIEEKVKKIEYLDQKIIEKKCEVDNYNLHICKKTGETFERIAGSWRCSTRLNLKDEKEVEEAKDKVKEMKKKIEILEKEVKELREELREKFNYYC